MISLFTAVTDMGGIFHLVYRVTAILRETRPKRVWTAVEARLIHELSRISGRPTHLHDRAAAF
jgi:hypothetical protein